MEPSLLFLCFFKCTLKLTSIVSLHRSYAQEWNNIQQELEEAGVGGPTYVSIGDSEKLNTFLEGYMIPFFYKA